MIVIVVLVQSVFCFVAQSNEDGKYGRSWFQKIPNAEQIKFFVDQFYVGKGFWGYTEIKRRIPELAPGSCVEIEGFLPVLGATNQRHLFIPPIQRRLEKQRVQLVYRTRRSTP